MSTELQSAYDDAMKRLRGSVLGPQLVEPIEAYVKELQEENQSLNDDITGLEDDLEDCRNGEDND